MSKSNSAYFNMKLLENLKELTIEFVQLYNSGEEITKKQKRKKVFLTLSRLAVTM